MILNIKNIFIISKINKEPPTRFCESSLTKSFCSTETDLGSLGRETFAFGSASLPWFALYICTITLSLVTTP